MKKDMLLGEKVLEENKKELEVLKSKWEVEDKERLEKSIKEDKEKEAELWLKAVNKVEEYNSVVLSVDYKEAIGLDEEIRETLDDHRFYASDIFYKKCLASNDPMLEAVTKLSYPILALKKHKIKDVTLPQYELIYKIVEVDIVRLNKRSKQGIGYNKDWSLMVEKLNLLLTCNQAVQLGIDPLEIHGDYDISDIAKSYNLRNNAISNRGLLKVLTAIVHAMIGPEYSPLGHDVRFLKSVYSKKSKNALTVTCASHKQLYKYIVNICHRIVINGTYEIEYKKKK